MIKEGYKKGSNICGNLCYLSQVNLRPSAKLRQEKQFKAEIVVVPCLGIFSCFEVSYWEVSEGLLVFFHYFLCISATTFLVPTWDCPAVETLHIAALTGLPVEGVWLELCCAPSAFSDGQVFGASASFF